VRQALFTRKPAADATSRMQRVDIERVLPHMVSVRGCKHPREKGGEGGPRFSPHLFSPNPPVGAFLLSSGYAIKPDKSCGGVFMQHGLEITFHAVVDFTRLAYAA